MVDYINIVYIYMANYIIVLYFIIIIIRIYSCYYALLDDYTV